ncbi:hypothetical protein N800_07370 [Lysobacter daejeonensis GH1-9]|uniref:Uncharacterized protein n=1 Tax=Lysobacter daejeonensis GH1-9 TaxID=1385517 RepID=A0A0A0ERB4_9GAMM|nr:hypothetical protein N800_07370 [Lysobacter daejeonensis GH1-9]
MRGLDQSLGAMGSEAQFISHETVDTAAVGVMFSLPMSTAHALHKLAVYASLDAARPCACAQATGLNWITNFTWAHRAGIGHV